MRRNTPSNKFIRGSRCPCPIGGSRRACGAGRASSRRAEQSSRHGQQAGGQASVPVGGGRAWPGFETTRQANDQQPSAGGVEAAGGRRQGRGGLSGRAKLRPVGGCRGACKAGLGSGGRRQGLAGLRDDAPSERSATKRRRCGGRRGACGAWPRCRWAAAGPGRTIRPR